MVRKFLKVAKIPRREWALLLQLILFSLAAAVTLRIVGLPRLVRFIAQCALKPWPSRFPLHHDRSEAGRLTALVELATGITHGRGRCLARSLALFWLLKARGEKPELVIGVSKEACTLNSHAWIESHGKIMADTPDVIGRFATLLRF